MIGIDTYLPNLTNITLWDLPNCINLPPFGQLPELHMLDIGKLASIRKIGKDLYGGIRAFPKLSFLYLENMECLKDWDMLYSSSDDSLNEHILPYLDTLWIRHCPRLRLKLCLPGAGGNNYSLSISSSDEVILWSWKAIGHVGASSTKCTSLNVECCDCEDAEALKELVPRDTVKELKLRGYRSINFPSWVAGIANYLPNLTTITLCDLPNCISLPPLGQLPELRTLRIEKMDSIRKIGGDLYGGIRAFPRLHSLVLEDMECLKDWDMLYSSSDDSLNEHILPCLGSLWIRHCPRLRLGPCLPGAGVDEELELSISCSDEVLLSSWEGGGHVGASSAKFKSTWLKVECCAAPLYQWSLLRHLPCLTYLEIKRCQDLTCSSPGVLGGLRSLQKLVVSRCGKSTSLPDCLGDLTSLKELRIHKCRRIKALPSSIQRLTNLQSLVISRCPDLELWCQSEENKLKLAHIKTLELMGDKQLAIDCDQDSESELEFDLYSLSDHESETDQEDENPDFLQIRPGNVKSAEEAQEIKLVNNRRIERLELVWTRDDKRFMEDDEVLKELLPPDTVKELKLCGYRSINFPSWVAGIANYLPNLTTISLCDLPNCISLPPLGQLPELRTLRIEKMDSIRKIGKDLYGGIRAFPRLHSLVLEGMECLEDWNMLYSSSEDSLNEHMLPCLAVLSIRQCPRLRLKPWLAGAGGNDYLSLYISSSDEVIRSSWEGRGHVSAFSAKCTELDVEWCVAPLYKWSFLCYLPCLTRLRITCCKNLTCGSYDIFRGLPFLRILIVAHCGRITSLPDCLGDLTSLEELRIHKCKSIKALPSSIQQLTNLQSLVISRCPDLEMWCQSEENKMKLALIKKLGLMGDEGLVYDRDQDSESELESGQDSLSDHDSENVQDSKTDQEDENPDLLQIRPGNVKSAKEAQEIKLVDKRRIERLHLSWTRDDKRFMEDDEVLKELLPPDTVKEFKLRGYRSINFPSWVMGIANYLPNLTTITLLDLPNCLCLPPLGQLPELRTLRIGKLSSIRKIGGDLYGGIRAFPRLGSLVLEDMKCLEDWNMLSSISEDSLNKHMLPCLAVLSIHQCPRLRLKPWLAGAGGNDSLSLHISNSDEVIRSSWEGRGHVSAFFAKCTELDVECCAAPLYQWSFLCYLPCLTHLSITCCQNLKCRSSDIFRGLPFLRVLIVARCGRITSLPDCLGDLTSLEELRIHKCRRIKALPGSIQQLTNLQSLVISRCPDLELWCQSEENKMKLAHIKKLELMGDEELIDDRGIH